MDATERACQSQKEESSMFMKTDLALCLPRSPLPHPAPVELPTGSTLAWCCASCRVGFMDTCLVQCSVVILKWLLNKWHCIFILHWALQIMYMMLTSGAPGTEMPLVATLCLCTGWAQGLRYRATS